MNLGHWCLDVIKVVQHGQKNFLFFFGSVSCYYRGMTTWSALVLSLSITVFTNWRFSLIYLLFLTNPTQIWPVNSLDEETV